MKRLFLPLLVIAFLTVSCTKKDCHCTYYDENGAEVPSYSTDYEDMAISDCSELNTMTEGGKGYICQ